MTTFSLLITLLGAATVSVSVVHLFDVLDQPHRHRRTV